MYSTNKITMSKKRPVDFIGCKVYKEFVDGWFEGEVESVKEVKVGVYYFHVKYEDGDEEDMDLHEVKEFVKNHKARLLSKGRTLLKQEPEDSSNGVVPDGSSSSSSYIGSFVLTSTVVSDSSIAVKEEDYKSLDISTGEGRGTKRSHDEVEAEAPSSGARIKTEEDLHKHQARIHRHYGDRVLLARQSKNGMMKLGGGNQSMILFPYGKGSENHPRFGIIGNHKAAAYNC